MKRCFLVLGGERGFMRTTITKYERTSIAIDSLIVVDKPKPETGKPLGFCGGHFSSVRGSQETLGVGLLGHVENMGFPEF